MDHLLHTENIPPSAITLIGDSAGAHLLLGLVLHISHSNPLVTPLHVDGHFSNAVLISPWVDMHTSVPSMQANKDKDSLTVEALVYWARTFMGITAVDYWNAPLTVPTQWWSDLPVDEILVLYGDNELLKDDTSTFCERLKVHKSHSSQHQENLKLTLCMQAHHPQTTAWKLPGEIHGHIVLNRFLKINKPCESERIYVKWMNDHLSS